MAEEVSLGISDGGSEDSRVSGKALGGEGRRESFDYVPDISSPAERPSCVANPSESESEPSSESDRISRTSRFPSCTIRVLTLWTRTDAVSRPADERRVILNLDACRG
jgi:hypothetical protein